MALMVSVSGIRGIFGIDLTPENLSLFASAYGTWLQKKTVVVGRDTRTSGEICESLVVSSLRAVGCDVISLGVVPTPTVAMGVLRHRAGGGIVISASHNPAEWNALKLLNDQGEFLDAEQGAQVQEIARKGQINYRDYLNTGSIYLDQRQLHAHIDEILRLPFIDSDSIRKANFRVSIDAVNGAGSRSLPLLLERLGVRHPDLIHCEPNGLFPHDPEPLPENLKDICSRVLSNGSDVGFVTDPDADRLAVIDETGRMIGEEYTQALAFEWMLKRKPGPVVTNLSSSRVCDDIAHRYNQVCHRSPVGEIHVVRQMQKVGAVIGGEGNGGVIHPGLHYGRDALVGTAILLQHMADEKKSMATLRNHLPDYVILKSKIKLQNPDSSSLLSRLASIFYKEKVTATDGVKIDFPDGWVHLRASNTEPVLRIFSEARNRENALELTSLVRKHLEQE